MRVKSGEYTHTHTQSLHYTEALSINTQNTKTVTHAYQHMNKIFYLQ
jgi:hypothetical protein